MRPRFSDGPALSPAESLTKLIRRGNCSFTLLSAAVQRVIKAEARRISLQDSPIVATPEKRKRPCQYHKELSASTAPFGKIKPHTAGNASPTAKSPSISDILYDNQVRLGLISKKKVAWLSRPQSRSGEMTLSPYFSHNRNSSATIVLSSSGERNARTWTRAARRRPSEKPTTAGCSIQEASRSCWWGRPSSRVRRQRRKIDLLYSSIVRPLDADATCKAGKGHDLW